MGLIQEFERLDWVCEVVWGEQKEKGEKVSDLGETTEKDQMREMSVLGFDLGRKKN